MGAAVQTQEVRGCGGVWWPGGTPGTCPLCSGTQLCPGAHTDQEKGAENTKLTPSLCTTNVSTLSQYDWIYCLK